MSAGAISICGSVLKTSACLISVLHNHFNCGPAILVVASFLTEFSLTFGVRVSFNPCSGLNFNLPTFASWVYALASNNIDPTIIALGAGDGQIRIWRMSSTSAMFDVNIIWQKLNSAKVTALSWHPDKENLLAFGTDEGRVGIVDAFSSRIVPSFCNFKLYSMLTHFFS